MQPAWALGPSAFLLRFPPREPCCCCRPLVGIARHSAPHPTTTHEKPPPRRRRRPPMNDWSRSILRASQTRSTAHLPPPKGTSEKAHTHTHPAARYLFSSAAAGAGSRARKRRPSPLARLPGQAPLAASAPALRQGGRGEPSALRPAGLHRRRRGRSAAAGAGGGPLAGSAFFPQGQPGAELPPRRL